jgi:8-amino-3,8-dideoxy-alpha-D-manno-octulosonate transaminase
MKSVTGFQGKGKPKIGVDEFMSIAERFGLSKSALEKVKAVLDAEDMGSGPFLANYYAGLPETRVQAFQRIAMETFGTKYAIGVSSGTGALHSAFTAAGVGPGTEVICPAIGFYATAAAVVMAKGVPVFADVDESLHIDPKKIEQVITPRTVAIAPTHVMGGVADMPAIMEVARKHNLKVVEDCAQSCGGKVGGKYVGTFGHLGIFSISAYKIVGGGEGGLIITDDERLWDRANCLAEGGGLSRPDRFALPRYEGELFCGTNYRMSELEAAVDVVQLGKMPETVARFRGVKRSITSRLKTYKELTPQKTNDADGDVGYMLRFFPETIELGQQIAKALSDAGIGAGIRGKNGRPDWHIYHDMFPITLKTKSNPDDCSFHCPHYAAKGGNIEYALGDCPVADDLFDRVVNVGLNQWYTEDDCVQFADVMNSVLSHFCTENAAGKPWR